MSLPLNQTYQNPSSQALAGAIKSVFLRPPAMRSRKAVGVSSAGRGVANQVRQMSGQGRAPMSTPLGPVTVPYGGSTRYEKFHPGIDIAAPIGTPISSYTGGAVKKVVRGKRQGDRGFGNYVLMIDDKGNTHRYSHLDQAYVQVGQRINPGFRLGTIGNCFDDQTEILTNEGWKLFKDLNKNELVLTGNLKTGIIEYQKPLAYIEKPYEYLYEFIDGHKHLHFVVSDDHRMLFKLQQDQKLKLKPLREISNRVYVPTNGFNNNNKDIQEFILPERKYVGDRWGTIRKDPALRINMDVWLAFLGFWLSDGWLVNTKIQQMVGITQSFKNFFKRKKIENILKKLPFHFGYSGEDYRIHRKQLFDYLEQYGTRNKKKIPEFIFTLSSRQIRIFIDAYYLGDGWKHKETRYCVFGEKRLADDFQILLVLSGSKGIIREIDVKKRDAARKKPPMINGKIIKATKNIWVITEPRYQYNNIVKNQLKKVNYNRMAYCITVANGIIYVRRNSIPMWSGNSGQTYSTTGGTGAHVDYRVRDAYQKYIDPARFLDQKRTL